MKLTWIVLLLAALVLPGCGGDNKPVNEGKERPKAKQEKDKEK
jgi:hypothetical protein